MDSPTSSERSARTLQELCKRLKTKKSAKSAKPHRALIPAKVGPRGGIATFSKYFFFKKKEKIDDSLEGMHTAVVASAGEKKQSSNQPQFQQRR